MSTSVAAITLVLVLSGQSFASTPNLSIPLESQVNETHLVNRKIRVYAWEPDLIPQATHWSTTIRVDNLSTEYTLTIVKMIGWTPSSRRRRTIQDDEDAKGWAELLVQIDTEKCPDLLQRLRNPKTIELVGYSYGFTKRKPSAAEPDTRTERSQSQ